MICPMKFSLETKFIVSTPCNGGFYNQIEEKSRLEMLACDKENCAWWDKENKCCALAGINRKLGGEK